MKTRGVFLKNVFIILFNIISVCFLLVTISSANGWQKTLVKQNNAHVYTEPNGSSKLIVVLKKGDVVGLMNETQDWCKIYFKKNNLEGWIKSEVIVQSEGIKCFLSGDHDVGKYEEAISLLKQEIEIEQDPLIASWKLFFLGYCYLGKNDIKNGIESFREIIKKYPKSKYVPVAYIAIAKSYYLLDDLKKALETYEKLLGKYPKFVFRYENFDDLDPYPFDVDELYSICSQFSGSSDINKRITLLKELLTAVDFGKQTLTNPYSSQDTKAEAQYNLASIWAKKTEIDPGRIMEMGMIVDTKDVEDAYLKVIELFPKSKYAGYSVFKLIKLDEPYEWEGDWRYEANWKLEQYGAFLKQYPDSELAGESLFEIGKANWVLAGYPEVYNLVFWVREKEDQKTSDIGKFEKKKKEVEKFFDISGFGGGPIEEEIPKDEGKVKKTLEIFQKVVNEYPKTKSAGLVKYYIGVVYDYCFNDSQEALKEFKEFVENYKNSSFKEELSRAKNRISEITKESGN